MPVSAKITKRFFSPFVTVETWNVKSIIRNS
jgi:hypothetical protein